jgi:hypothetical protein
VDEGFQALTSLVGSSVKLVIIPSSSVKLCKIYGTQDSFHDNIVNIGVLRNKGYGKNNLW